ncbi:DUF2189 domain-containing protein [Rhodopila sp.]|uniref:DUF2189 domain-containing protein n=1 Tax=Rhodopila sp. TaxID=2480087 RepID=UPI003D12FFF5
MIKTPPGWGADMVTRAYNSFASTSRQDAELQVGTRASLAVCRISGADLGWALRRGFEDFGAARTDVIFLCVLYPLIGLLLARLAFGYEFLPLVFPLAAGFALVGPVAGVGLNEISRRRELGEQVGWFDAFNVFRSPSIVGIMLLGFVLLGMLLAWLVVSQLLYVLTMGPQAPASLGDFVYQMLHTSAGWTMMIVGIGIGFVFAAIALTIGAVSFPLLLDRAVSLETAVRTSAEVVRRNPLTMAAWGLIIAVSLVLGSIPLLLGLVFVMPVLGHATWHLYRRAVPR